MNYNVGDLVLCPPSGSRPGNRIGKVQRVSKRVNGTNGEPVLVGYIDYPEEAAGWFYGYGAWVHPLRKIVIKEIEE